jgi:sugar phosphate isomerase/epimerase
MKLACADFAFPLLEHDKVLDLIAALEFDGVDIGLFEERSHLWPSQEFKNLSKSASSLRKKLRARGLACADVFLQMAPKFIDFAINHPEAARRRKARDWFLRTLDFACRVECRHLTSLPGVTFARKPAADSWARCLEELAWRVEQAGSFGIIFSIEAHTGSIAPDPKKALRLVRSVPGLTLTLDYTHFTRRGVPDSAIEPLVAHASHFHARAARKGRLQTSFSQNTIDYARVLRAMRRTKYRGYVGVEYVWIDWEHCNKVDNLSETILLRDFLRSHLKA